MNNRGFYIFLYLVIWFLLLFFIPNFIQEINISNLDWIIFILIFTVQPYILSKVLKNTIQNKQNLFALCMSTIFLAIPYALFLEHNDEKELEKYGIETKAVVIDIHRARISKGHYDDVFNAEYTVNGFKYQTKSISITKINCKIGDTIVIQYSKNHPSLNNLTNY